MNTRSSDNETLPDDLFQATSLTIPLLPADRDSKGAPIPQDQEVTITLRLRLVHEPTQDVQG